MKTYMPSFKPSTPKAIVCAALVRLEGVGEPLFLYFDGVKDQTKHQIAHQVRLHWQHTLKHQEPLPDFQVVASQEFPSQQQDVLALSSWLETHLARARAA